MSRTKRPAPASGRIVAEKVVESTNAQRRSLKKADGRAAALAEAKAVEVAGEAHAACPSCHEDCVGWVAEGSACGRKDYSHAADPQEAEAEDRMIELEFADLSSHTDCPQVGTFGHHSEGYSEGDPCAWCGKKPEPRTWRVVAVDNFDRDNVDDWVAAEGLTKTEAEAKAAALQAKDPGDYAAWCYRVVDPSYKLKIWEP